ncbi:MAG: hypothetical protein KDA45_08200 [Planctomycetales bacterium]|nr:hypothetical protein [Planctomycetales bacterium]
MSATQPQPTPKVHPASREMLPADPLEMHAVEVPGDPEFMLRLLVEEFARIGWGLEELMGLAGDPNYGAFHGLQKLYGEDELRQRVQEILSRCGVIRVTSCERPPAPQQVVQIDFPE